MKRKSATLALLLAACTTATAQKTVEVNVANNSKNDLKAVPVVVSLAKYGMEVKSALVTLNGKEIASQIDDIDKDGINDELCFVTDIAKHGKLTFSLRLEPTGEPRKYEAKTYAEMLLPNKNVKGKNKQNLFISSITANRGGNTYSVLHHHGPAFENEYIAFRLYFDHRQTVDMYGKRRKGLEIKDTQFYPDKEQLANGYGDDVLWVGNSFGLGALRGWDGNKPVMLDDVEYRTMRIVESGPVRAIVEVEDKKWNTGNAGKEPVYMTTRYTVYAGRRDCFVDVRFNKSATDYKFSTGVINVKNSEEFSDKHGLRGCWGTDWPVALKDSAGHKPETVGLAIHVPERYIIKEMPADTDNYAFVVGNADTQLHYNITFASDNETFGYHSAKEWFSYLKEWKKQLESDVDIKY